MPWSRIEIEVEDDEEESVGLDPLKIGLDVDAQQMHELFLGGLPHLSEVQDRHEEILDGVSSTVGDAKALARAAVPIGDFLAEIGGEWSGSEVRIPLPSSFPEGVVVETLLEEEEQIVRLIAPERFGGMLRTFRLPTGEAITGANWEDGVLTMRTSRSG
ncbi:MAG: hypothetical protein VX502_05345 [Candidatus Thermoplasmatota archaeon]|nr:hypothetical protein [Candidatus Thermoplasmatota archaeon]